MCVCVCVCVFESYTRLCAHVLYIHSCMCVRVRVCTHACVCNYAACTCTRVRVYYHCAHKNVHKSEMYDMYEMRVGCTHTMQTHEYTLMSMLACV